MEKGSKAEQASQVKQDLEAEEDGQDDLIEKIPTVQISFKLAKDLEKTGFVSDGLEPTPQSTLIQPSKWPSNRLYEGFELEDGTDTLVKVLHYIKQRYRQPTLRSDGQKCHHLETMDMIYNTLYLKTKGLLCSLSSGKLPKQEKYVALLILGHPEPRSFTINGEEQKASEEQKKIVAEMLGKKVSDIKEWQIWQASGS